MSNQIFQQIVRARVRGAIAEAQALKGLNHKLVKGRLREIALENLLKPLAPPNYLLGSGVVMDHSGGQSGEIDIIVANRSTTPGMNFSARDGLYPLESVCYAIEVKSSFEHKHIEEVIQKFGALRKLRSLPAGELSTDTIYTIGRALRRTPTTIPQFVYAPNTIKPPTVLFAYRSTKWFASYLDKITVANNASPLPVVEVICVPGRGYWWRETAVGWHHTKPSDDYNEVLMFLAGLSNTMFGNQSRFTGVRFGNYLA